MRRMFVYSVLGVAALGIGVVAICFCIPASLPHTPRQPADPADNIHIPYEGETQPGGLTIRYPLDETLFPPEIAPPTFRWEDARHDVDGWLVTFEFQDEKEAVRFASRAMEWTPSDEQWQAIKRRSVEKPVRVAVLGFNRGTRSGFCRGPRFRSARPGTKWGRRCFSGR